MLQDVKTFIDNQQGKIIITVVVERLQQFSTSGVNDVDIIPATVNLTHK